MVISCKMVMRGCRLIGQVLFLLLLLKPALSFRLQTTTKDQHHPHPISTQSFQSQSHNNSSSKSYSGWPPRIPLWGFLPSSPFASNIATPTSPSSSSTATQTSNSYQQQHHHLNNIINGEKVMNSQHSNHFASSIKANHPSKRDLSSSSSSSSSSPSASSSSSHKGLDISMNRNKYQHQFPINSNGPHFSLIDDNDDEDVDSFDDEINELDDNWILNLKRSNKPNQQRPGLGGVKRNRMYDVPQIECPPAEDGMERFACPSPDNLGRYPCVDDHVLCDGFVDCPGREDEDRQACMFYKTTKAHLDVLADALLRWARGRR